MLALNDIQERNQLVERHLNLARKIAYQYCRRYPNLTEDLLQIAVIGLIKAVDKFDPKRGFAFSSFAAPWIRGEIQHYFQAGGGSCIKVPRPLYKNGVRVEICSLDRFVRREGKPIPLEETIADYRQITSALDSEELEEIVAAISLLGGRKSLILAAYFKGVSVKTIAKYLGLHPMTIHRDIKQGADLLRAQLLNVGKLATTPEVKP